MKKKVAFKLIFYHFSRPAFAIVLLATLLSCRPPSIPPAPDSPKRAVIFLHGYKGSLLKSRATGETAWLTLGTVLFGGESLVLSEPPELVATEIIREVSFMWRLFSYPVYSTFLDLLHDNLDHETYIYELAYDWRRDNRLAVNKLAAAVESLEARGIKQIDAVGHSMGGLVLAFYLRYGGGNGEPEWAGARRIRRAVFAATPFGGSMSALRDLQRGNPVGPNTSALSADVLATFPSIFQLLPDGHGAVLLDQYGRQAMDDISDPDEWRRNRLRPEGEIILDRGLAAERDFLPRLRKPPLLPAADGLTEILNIAGKGLATPWRCYVFPDTKERVACSADELEEMSIDISPPISMLESDGDGVVTVEAAQLPEAFYHLLETTSLTVRGEHLAMLSDEKVQRRILDFLGAPE